MGSDRLPLQRHATSEISINKNAKATEKSYPSSRQPPRTSWRQSIQTYIPTGTHRDPEIGRLKSAHIGNGGDYDLFQYRELCQRRALVTVSQTKPTNNPASSVVSFASSGLTVEEIPSPTEICQTALQRPAGVYRCILTKCKSVGSGESLAGVTRPDAVVQGSRRAFAPSHDCSELDAMSMNKSNSDSDSFLDDEKPGMAEFTYTLQRIGTYNIATREELDLLQAVHPLVPATASRRSWWRYMCMTAYRRLMAVVLISNITALAMAILKAGRNPESSTYNDAATAIGANLFVTVLMRHEHFINLLFRTATSIPCKAPVWLRRDAAKLAYSQGGIHAGCGISAFLWYVLFTVLLCRTFAGQRTAIYMHAIYALASFNNILLLMIVTISHPWVRKRYHNFWELTHRFGGYAAVGSIWAQTIIISQHQERVGQRSMGRILIEIPSFWFLAAVTSLLIYPWLHLRRRRVAAEQLSTHTTRLWFPNRRLPTCVGTRLSNYPMIENHAFATIPNPDGAPGYSIIVSNAGDWTRRLIQDHPTHVWMRGAPIKGVMRVASLFRPLVVVATGAGIGPCLSYLQARPEHPMRVIWAARLPEATYGREVVKAVLRADEAALIIDTKVTGHPDLVALAYAMYREMAAEAVVIISNPTVTGKVVYEMELRNVPAFGAIFDS